MYPKWRRFRFNNLLPLLIAFCAGFSLAFFPFNLIFNWPIKENEINIDFNLDHLNNYFIICLIFTSVNNIARRNCIRNTWVNFGKNLQFKYYFVIGTDQFSSTINDELSRENSKNNDLLLLPNLSDTYNNLSLKLLQSLKWTNDNHRGKFQFILKVDDDSFVRIDALYNYLEQLYQNNHSGKPIYLGFFDGRAHVKQKGIWKEKNWFLCDRYLPYAVGGGYVLSHELIRYISVNAPLFQLYQSEDVTLGTWLAPLSIERKHDIRFDTEYRSRGCFNTFLVQHKQTINEMKMKYNSLLNYGQLCPEKQFQNRLTYEYNWNVLPSKCCIRNKTMF